MACDVMKPRLIANLYGELDPADASALEEHFAACEDCAREMDSLRATRNILGEGAPPVPHAPRVVVLEPRPRMRAWSAFAAGLACAAIVGAGGVGAGLAFTRRPAPAVVGLSEAEASRLVQQEIDRRWTALQAELSRPAAATKPQLDDAAPVTTKELDAAFARFERRINGNRAADIDYMLGRMAAYERKTGASIGQTQEALRYVALASNPNLTQR